MWMPRTGQKFDYCVFEPLMGAVCPYCNIWSFFLKPKMTFGGKQHKKSRKSQV